MNVDCAVRLTCVTALLPVLTATLMLPGCGLPTEIDCLANMAPNADAGVDQNVVVGDSVRLNGIASTDPEGAALTYTWTQRQGTGVSLQSDNSPHASFVPTESGTYEFVLTVDDGCTQDSAAVFVFADTHGGLSGAPAADAGVDQTVKEGSTVHLRGGNSDDPSGSPLAYRWIQIAGQQVSLTGRFTAEATFVAPEVSVEANLEFELTVTNADGYDDTDAVVVTVQDTDVQPVDGEDGDGDDPQPDGCECDLGNCGDDQLCDPSTCECVDCLADATCDDGDLCTADACFDGQCYHTPITCSDWQTCDPVTGRCVPPGDDGVRVATVSVHTAGLRETESGEDEVWGCALGQELQDQPLKPAYAAGTVLYYVSWDEPTGAAFTAEMVWHDAHGNIVDEWRVFPQHRDPQDVTRVSSDGTGEETEVLGRFVPQTSTGEGGCMWMRSDLEPGTYRVAFLVDGTEVDALDFMCDDAPPSSQEPVLLTDDLEEWDAADAMHEPDVVYSRRSAENSSYGREIWYLDASSGESRLLATVDFENARGRLSADPQISADGCFATCQTRGYSGTDRVMYVYDTTTGDRVKRIGSPDNRYSDIGASSGSNLGNRFVVFPSNVEFGFPGPNGMCDCVPATAMPSFPPIDWYQAFFHSPDPCHWWQNAYAYVNGGIYAHSNCGGDATWGYGPGLGTEVWWTRVDDVGVEHTTCAVEAWWLGAFIGFEGGTQSYHLLSDSPRTGYEYLRGGGLSVSEDEHHIAYAGSRVYGESATAAVILWNVDASCDSSSKIREIPSDDGDGIIAVGLSGSGSNLLGFWGEEGTNQFGLYMPDDGVVLLAGPDEWDVSAIHARRLSDAKIRIVMRTAHFWHGAHLWLQDLTRGAEGQWHALASPKALQDIVSIPYPDSTNVGRAQLTPDGRSLIVHWAGGLYRVSLPEALQ